MTSSGRSSMSCASSVPLTSKSISPGCPFLDADGVRVLLQCRTDARQLDCRLTLADVQPDAYRVLKTVGLLERFGVAGPAAP